MFSFWIVRAPIEKNLKKTGLRLKNYTQMLQVKPSPLNHQKLLLLQRKYNQ
jgi:hypothetical protein